MFDETFEQAWKERYGSEPGFHVPGIDRILSHRSVRSFSDRPVSEETLKALVAAAQSAATSSNLQLWSVVSVQGQDRNDRLATLCSNQAHVSQCGVFFAFLADHYRMSQAAAPHNEDVGGLEYLEYGIMAIIDASLAAERMVCAAEAMGLGICYIGSLRNDPQGVKECLNLPEGVFGCFGLCVGYPAEPLTAEIKPRLAQHAVWFKETYDLDPDTAEYDERMRAFYDAQNMKGAVTWSMRSARRLGEKYMSGRQALLQWLNQQGMFRR